MKTNHSKTEHLMRRILALLLVLLTAGFAPSEIIGTEASAAGDSQLGIVKGWEWHRVNVAEDLPAKGTRCPVLILWKKDNSICYANGGYECEVTDDDWDAVWSKSWIAGTDGLPDPFTSTGKDTDTFVTTDVMTTWEMYVTGDLDDDNHDAPQVRFYPTKNCLLTGYDDFDFPKAETADDDHWTIYTSQYGGKYGKNISAGRVKIFANVKYRDTGFMYYGTHLYGMCSSTYNYDTFIMYWGEERNITAITDDYNIASGQVLNVDDGVILMDNKTIVVEPGGVLSIEGTFYNNGTIENHGTVILQENACVCCSPQSSSSAGRVLCSGADVSLKDYADLRIAQDYAQIESLLDLVSEERIPSSSDYNIPPKRGSLINQRDTLSNACGLMESQVESWQGQIDTLDDQKDKLDLLESLYEDMTDIQKLITDDTEDIYASQSRKLAEQMRLLTGIKVSETNTLDQNIDALSEQIDKLRDEYKKAYEPYRQYLDEYNNCADQLAQMKAQIASLNDTITWLKKDIEAYGKVSDERVAGDGNLIMLNGSKLVIGTGNDAGLRIESGANLTCSGYIISPHSITLSSAKLKICDPGVLFANYYLSGGVANVPSLELSNPGTLDASFSGLTGKTYSGEQGAVALTGDYVFEVDGVFRYSDKCAVKITQYVWATQTDYVDPNFGHGLWVSPTKPVPSYTDPTKPGNNGPANNGGNGGGVDFDILR